MKYHGIQARVALMAVMLLASGCGIRPLSEGMRARVLAGKELLVLLRVDITVNGAPDDRWDPLQTLADSYELELTQLGDAVGSFDRSLDAESKKRGWVYALVKDGTYYLNLRYGGDYWEHNTKKEPGLVFRQAFRVEVPADARAMYLGTIRGDLVRPGASNDDRPGFAEGSLRVADESIQARELLAKHFPEVGTPRILLMRIDDGSTRVIRTSTDAPRVHPGR